MCVCVCVCMCMHVCVCVYMGVDSTDTMKRGAHVCMCDACWTYFINRSYVLRNYPTKINILAQRVQKGWSISSHQQLHQVNSWPWSCLILFELKMRAEIFYLIYEKDIFIIICVLPTFYSLLCVQQLCYHRQTAPQLSYSFQVWQWSVGDMVFSHFFSTISQQL